MPVITRSLEGLGIDPIPFSILSPDHSTARVALYQCCGQVTAEDSVSNTDSEVSIQKFLNFFQIAKSDNAALALTPEYSCPWAVIEKIIESPELQPKPAAIWVIGCESITPDDLNKLKATTDKFVNWQYETVTPNGVQTFLSPVIYLFKANGKEPNLCAIVQFKNHDMGGTNFERDQLIKGTVRYEIQNPKEPASITLTTLICADAMVFDIDSLTAHIPYLILHPQLNLEPYKHTISDYRCKLFSTNGIHYEVIALNWAKGFFINKKESKDKGGSAYFMHPNEEGAPDQSDAVADNNHRNGVYLNYSQSHRYFAYFFAPEEAIFIFDTSKVSQYNAPLANRVRSGLQNSQAYVWDGNNYVISSIKDQVQDYFENSGGEVNLKPSERHKLIAISIGDLNPDSIVIPKTIPSFIKEGLYPIYWHAIKNLESLRLGVNETPKGYFASLLDAQEPVISKAIAGYAHLKNILSSPDNLPDVFSDLKSETPILSLDLSDHKGHTIRHNIKKSGTKNVAAAAYLGDSLPTVANKVFDKIKDTLLPQRLAIWYLHNGQKYCKSDKLPEVTDGEDSSSDIMKDTQ